MKNDQPLNIAFLWHQHQPYYRTTDSSGRSVYLLPWVRLHAVKDYYDIPVILGSFPRIRQNFNLVPSLIAQIEDYVENRATDVVVDLTLKEPTDLSVPEKEKLLDLFFMANYERMIEPYNRYYQLLKKKLTDADFSEQDISDLQVWYNLCWVGESWKHKEPFASLFAKERGFTADDKRSVIEGHYAVMAEVIPLYRRLIRSGSIECSVTPFYHPILPLLCDSAIASVSDPYWIEPDSVFKYPEDADTQIRRAVDFFETRFHHKPAGMWPSEGSVSEETCSLIRAAGIQWIATDEGILAHSDTEASEKNLLNPYRFYTPHGNLMMVFRDHGLSDAIGFQYARVDPTAAAHDFYQRIESIRRSIIDDGKNPADCLLPVILDGENCWEFYEQNGLPFLTALYELLSESNTLRSVTIGDFIRSRQENDFPEITRLHPGSWINHNFRIWIGGHEEENTAWSLLGETRNWLTKSQESGKYDAELIREAFEEIYIAEGSDWFWWFGHDHWAHNKYQFDELFRYHLRRVYELLGEPAPPVLHQPIMQEGGDTQAIRLPAGLISPKLDGRISHYYEWHLAGVYESRRDSDTMAVTDAWINKIFFGSDAEYFYIRVDFFDELTDSFINDTVTRLRIEITEPKPITWIFHGNPDRLSAEYPGLQALFDEVFELAVPLDILGVGAGDTVGFFVSIMEHDIEIIRRPSRQPIRMQIPDDYSDRYLWSV